MKTWTTSNNTIKFELDKVETQRYYNFQELCKHAEKGCIEIKFHPTSIGMSIELRHTGLGVKCNITNYESW